MIMGRDYERILDRVLKRIKPTEEEEEKDKQFIGGFVKRLDSLTPKDVEIRLAGSTAKGTNLRGDKDFDVFMLFAPTYSVKQLMTLGLQWAKKAVKGHKYEIAYAEHPYLRAWVEGSEIDIVPSFKITDISERVTAVDRSPLHTQWIKAHMGEEQHDEVRLFKQFLKGTGIYGAEGKIQGFSGYLCELLIARYGTFLKLLDEASQFKGVTVIDLEGTESAVGLKQRFADAAMIVIDPVDENRNVAAAVSKTSLSLLVHSAREFLIRPSERFFFPSVKKVDMKWVAKQLAGRDSQIFGIEFKKPQIVEDILWPQLYKFASKIMDRAKDNNFSVFDTDVCEKNGKCLVLVEFEIFHLPRVRKVVGPPLWYRGDVEEFIKKHNVVEPIWFEHDKILALGRRRFVHAEELMRDIMKRAKAYGVPPDILKSMRTAKLLDAKGVVRSYPEFLFTYLQKRNI